MVRTVDLFCGGGLSSWGASMAGAEIVAAVDAWDVAARTFKRNFPHARVVNKRLSMDAGPEIIGRDIGKVDLLIASPECTNHSIAKGNKPRDEESRRSGNFVIEFLRKMGSSAPRWVVLENVMPLQNWEGYKGLLGGLRRLGYDAEPVVIDASEYGVPQARRRLFVICDREAKPRMPERTHFVPITARTFIRPFGTWKAGPLFTPTRSENTLSRARAGIAALGEGKDFLVIYYGSDKAGGWQSLDRPLRTITTLDRFGLVQWHGGQPNLRMLQVPELRDAMGLAPRKPARGPSANFKLTEGNRRDQVRIIGNGVAAPVMTAIVRSLTANVPISTPVIEPVASAA
ncbi:DNA cytosine methyltransferase [Methylobacterium sp. NMS12]|uniref:DNA cytosine methyltransferase n=1 Tax=Methylobacterium sp. NMS12 TaxID=3079766 RepID=UPI003F8842DF